MKTKRKINKLESQRVHNRVKHWDTKYWLRYKNRYSSVTKRRGLKLSRLMDYYINFRRGIRRL